MQVWSDAWRSGDADRLASLYADGGIVLHPVKPMIMGRAAIREFFEGSMGTMDVRFEARDVDVRGDMAFEYGTYTDVDRSTGNAFASGSYAAMWVFEYGDWKLKCNAWNDPMG